MFYSILLNLKSLFLYRKRYLVSQILTFTALSFVVLTAAKVIAAHSEVADFANTNIYTFAIREDAQPADLAAALKRRRPGLCEPARGRFLAVGGHQRICG